MLYCIGHFYNDKCDEITLIAEDEFDVAGFLEERIPEEIIVETLANLSNSEKHVQV